ncbi:MAG TPA: hypothetical protein VGV89_10425 [Thermoplasmata archaeon]|nr:hypothetical protein [Thermoplasmata archaeon]
MTQSKIRLRWLLFFGLFMAVSLGSCIRAISPPSGSPPWLQLLLAVTAVSTLVAALLALIEALPYVAPKTSLPT